MNFQIRSSASTYCHTVTSVLLRSHSILRSELESRSSSVDPADVSPGAEARLYEQLKQSFGEQQQEVTAHDNIEVARNEDAQAGPTLDGDEAYDFRLFARPSQPGKDSETRKIALRSPTPANGQSGFIKPRRPESYYFAQNNSHEDVEKFRIAAMSGDQIFDNLKIRWKGCEMPWRVSIIKSNGHKTPSGSLETPQEVAGKRKRSGKKRRIILRKRMAAKSAKEVAARQSQAEKEAAERGKKTRKNREKKIKKRQKEKLKKSQEVVDEG